MKDQGKMAISFGINTFINKNITFFVINHRYGFKRFSYNGWITNFMGTFYCKILKSVQICKVPFFC